MPDALDTGMLALRQRFFARLPERRTRIALAFARWEAGEDSAEALGREAHSLAGAAALHDCTALSRAARRLEERLREGALSSAAHTACAELLASLDNTRPPAD